MSLSNAKPTLYKDILKIFDGEAGATEKPEESRKRIAQELANAIDKFVRAGKVEIESGIAVNTSGGSGATTGKGIGKII